MKYGLIWQLRLNWHYFAIIIAVVIGINAGIISAWFQNSWFDYTAMILALSRCIDADFLAGSDGAMGFCIGTSVGYRLREGNKYGIQLTPLRILYVLDTIIQGRFDQLWQVIQASHFTGSCLGDYSDGNYCTDDAVKYAGSNAFRLYSYCTGERTKNVLGRL